MTETGDRAAFLARARAAGPWSSPIRPLPPLPDPIPPVAYATGAGDLVARFTAALTAVAGRVVRGDPDAVVAELLDRHPVERAGVSIEPEVAPIADALSRGGVEVVRAPDRSVLPGLDVGVTSAVAGVALTGSVVLDASRTGGRALAVLPPVHLVVLPSDRLVATPGDVLRSWSGREMPSNLAFVTGPSRSADIELQITLGVHGPKEVWVLLS